MRRALLTLALLAPIIALAGGIRFGSSNSIRAGGTGGAIVVPGTLPSARVFHFAGTTSGAYAVSTSATAYCRGEDYNGTTLTCSVSGAWDKQGTITSNSASAIYPTDFSSAARKTFGPFTDSDYFTIDDGDDILDTTGDFYMCTLSAVTSVAGSPMTFSNGVVDTAGYFQVYLSDSTGQFAVEGASNDKRITTTNTITTYAVNAFCGGRSGTTVVGKLNTGTYRTTAGAATTAGTAQVARLGRYNGAGEPLTGMLHEFVWISGTPTEAIFDAYIQRALGHTATTGSALTVTRGSIATYIPVASTGTMYRSSTSVARITESGLMVEYSTANGEVRSEEFDNAAWTKSNVTVTANSANDPLTGTATVDTLEATSSGGYVEGTGFAGAAQRYTASVWAQTTSGTQAFDIAIRDSTAGADLISCSKTATTTLTRFSCADNADATNGNTIKTRIFPGGTGGTGTIRAWGAQLESSGNVNGRASSYIATTSAAVTRASDVVSITNPLTASIYCLDVTAVPGEGTAWNALHSNSPLFQLGTSNGGADSLQFYVEPDGEIACDVYDATATLKQAKGNTALTGTSAKRITCCSGGSGTPSIYVDGASQAVTASGAGTGTITTQSGTAYIGAFGVNGGGGQFGGYLKQVRIAKSADVSRL